MNMKKDVSREDLQQLSAMLDGEVSNAELDTMLRRMEHQPELKKAFGQLSRVQAAAHRHAQAGFEIDLSDRIAQKLASPGADQNELKVATPVIPFDIVAKSSRDAVDNSYAGVERRRESVSMSGFKAISNSAHENAHVQDSTVQSFAKLRKKGFKKQMLAHLAVAASVASITVWIQNSMMESPSNAVALQSSVQSESQFNTRANSGVLPVGLRSEQVLPMATVGNKSIDGQVLDLSSRVKPASGNAVPEHVKNTETNVH